ncbi:MAG: hypothetical protein ABGX27_02050 [Desulfurobacteriaceae bacterium]
MRKGLTLLFAFFFLSCGAKTKEVNTKPLQKKDSSTLKAYSIDDVVKILKRRFTPVKGQVVLKSFEGYLLDVGKNKGVSVGDIFVFKEGSVLRIKEVKDTYSIAISTIGKPTIGDQVNRFSFRKVLFLNFAGEKGEKLYEKIKKEINFWSLSSKEEENNFKKKFSLKLPEDFREKVSKDDLKNFDAFFIVSPSGIEIYDTTKTLVKFIPFSGINTTLSVPYEVILSFDGHARSLFIGNIDRTQEKEIVVAVENKIEVFHLSSSFKAQKVYEFENPLDGSYIFHLSPVDVDRDGRFEILVNSFDDEAKKVSSGIFKVRNGKLVKIATSDLVVSGFDTNGDGVNDVIYGQEVSRSEDSFYKKGIYVLKLEKEKLEEREKVSLPFDFQVTSGQFLGKYVVYYDPQGYLSVAIGDKVIWRSPKVFGFSPNVLSWYVGDYLVSYYLSPKPKVIDIDEDGNLEVLVSESIGSVSKILRNIANFKGGRILLVYKDKVSFGIENVSNPVYKIGGIEDFEYLPEYNVFISIFTKSNLLGKNISKLLIQKTRI